MIRTSAAVRNPISAGAVAEADAVEMTVSHVSGGKAGAPEPVAAAAEAAAAAEEAEAAAEAKAEKAKNAARRERLLRMLDGIEQTGEGYKARLAALLGEALRPGAWVLSTAPLADARLARRQEGVHVKTSWTGGAKVDVYQVVGAP